MLILDYNRTKKEAEASSLYDYYTLKKEITESTSGTAKFQESEPQMFALVNGELIIFWYPIVLPIKSQPHRFMLMF